MRPILAALAVSTALSAGAASADHWRQTADPMLVMALDQVIGTYQYYCSMGMQQGCQLAQSAQMEAGTILNASYDCVAYGNPQACAYYQYAGGQVMMYQQQMMGLQGGQAVANGSFNNPLGNTHQERMSAIEQFGAQSTTNFNNRMAQMDANHAAFMSTINN